MNNWQFAEPEIAAEFPGVYEIGADFEKPVEAEFQKPGEAAIARSSNTIGT